MPIIHTDNNYTTIEKTKLSTIEEGAEVNVQPDWNEVSNLSDSFIKNKPTIPRNTSDLTNDSNFVVDSSYVHTDNNYTTTEKTKLSGIQSGAEVNVNADWNSVSEDSKILNKPSIIDNALTLTNPTIEYVVKNNTLVESTGGGSGASTFVELTDTPSSYSGEGGKVVSVKSDGTGLEFTTPSGGGASGVTLSYKFLQSSDVTFTPSGLNTFTPNYIEPNKNFFVLHDYGTHYHLEYNFYGKYASGNVAGHLNLQIKVTLPTNMGINADPSLPIIYGSAFDSMGVSQGSVSYNRTSRMFIVSMIGNGGIIAGKTSNSLLLTNDHHYHGNITIPKNPLPTWSWT